jgi:hypothetical protein
MKRRSIVALTSMARAYPAFSTFSIAAIRREVGGG